MLLLCAGCTLLPSTSGSKERAVHVKGHWTLGVVFSVFYTLDQKESYTFDPDGFPPEVRRYLNYTLPSHRDSDSDNGEAKSIYLEFDGVIFNDPAVPAVNNPSIRVVKLYKYGPPHKDYLKFRASP